MKWRVNEITSEIWNPIPGAGAFSVVIAISMIVVAATASLSINGVSNKNVFCFYCCSIKVT